MRARVAIPRREIADLAARAATNFPVASRDRRAEGENQRDGKRERRNPFWRYCDEALSVSTRQARFPGVKPNWSPDFGRDHVTGSCPSTRRAVVRPRDPDPALASHARESVEGNCEVTVKVTAESLRTKSEASDEMAG